MSASFFRHVLEQAAHWQVHIPRDDAFGDMVLRPFAADATLPEGRGLIAAQWCAKPRAYNCQVDVQYLMDNIKEYTHLVDIRTDICDAEVRFLAMRLFAMAEQSHPMPDARRVTLCMFHLLWAMRSPVVGDALSPHIHGFLSDLRAFTEANLHLRARHSAIRLKKRPIQEGESCAIVAENGLLMLRLLCTSLTIPARFLEA